MSEAKSEYLSLAAEFSSVDQSEWRQLINAALKGASFKKRLTSETYDGLCIEPLYPRAVGAQPVFGREPGKAWAVVQRIDHPDPKTANAQILEDLENGADGLALILAGAPAARDYGVVVNSVDDLERALAEVVLNMISLRLETAPFAGRTVAMLVNELVTRRKLDPATIKIDFGLDPIGDMARTGQTILPGSELLQRTGSTAKDLRERGFGKARLLRADGRSVHDAGGSEAQELAFVLATGVAYLRLLEANGFSLDEARRCLSFLISADNNEFLIIAKFRSLRKLWARIEEACGLAPQPAFISAETAWRMMTARDPYVNILRTTIAVTAAGIGGSDSITALPFTNALGLPDRFARRVARNMQSILLEESNLHRVADPAAGSGAIEDLTTKLCHAAWTEFQKFEKTGGAWMALEHGIVQRDVATVREKRKIAIAHRKDAIIGTSDYPNLNEECTHVLDVAPVAVSKETSAVAFIEPLSSIRLAEPFELLRDKSDAIFAKTGSRPKVFLATLGTLSDFTTRATFAKNFYEAGGIEAVSNEGFVLSSPFPTRGGQSPMAAAWTSPRLRGEVDRMSVSEGGRVRERFNDSEPMAKPLTPTLSPLAGRGSGGAVSHAIALPTREEVKKGAIDRNTFVAAFKASGAKLACICSSDKIYASEAGEAAKALTEAGAIVHLAGQPGELETQWQKAGVHEFIYSGCDALSILEKTYEILGF